MEVRNTTLDDIAAVIGFTATIKLAMWFGNRKYNLWVPTRANEDHVIAKLIGVPAMSALVKEWGDDHLAVPSLHGMVIEGRNATIRDLLLAGHGTKQIAASVGVTERRVQQLRREFEAMGLLPVNPVGRTNGD